MQNKLLPQLLYKPIHYTSLLLSIFLLLFSCRSMKQSQQDKALLHNNLEEPPKSTIDEPLELVPEEEAAAGAEPMEEESGGNAGEVQEPSGIKRDKPSNGSGLHNPIPPPKNNTGSGKVPPSNLTAPKTITAKPSDNLGASTSLADKANQNLLSIQRGHIKYDSIPKLFVDKPFTFKLTIVPGDLDSLKTGTAAGAATKTIVESIDISSEMAVRIEAQNPNAFDLKNLSDIRQAILPNGTTWIWDITPRIAGTHRVKLIVEIVTKSNVSGEILKTNIVALDKDVEVVVNASQQSHGTPSNAETTAFPWYWLLAIPLAGLVFWFVKKQRATPHPSPTPVAVPYAMPMAAPTVAEAPATTNDYTIKLPASKVIPFLDTVEKLIEEGEVEKALEDTIAFFEQDDEQLQAELRTLSATFSEYQKEKRLNLGAEITTLNKITFGFSEVLIRVKECVAK